MSGEICVLYRDHRYLTLVQWPHRVGEGRERVVVVSREGHRRMQGTVDWIIGQSKFNPENYCISIFTTGCSQCGAQRMPFLFFRERVERGSS
jgi:hypothetical protein